MAEETLAVGLQGQEVALVAATVLAVLVAGRATPFACNNDLWHSQACQSHSAMSPRRSPADSTLRDCRKSPGKRPTLVGIPTNSHHPHSGPAEFEALVVGAETRVGLVAEWQHRSR